MDSGGDRNGFAGWTTAGGVVGADEPFWGVSAGWIGTEDGLIQVTDDDGHGHDLIVGTHGRGFWVMDDITPLRQVSDTILQSGAWLFSAGRVAAAVPTPGRGRLTPRRRPTG